MKTSFRKFFFLNLTCAGALALAILIAQASAQSIPVDGHASMIAQSVSRQFDELARQIEDRGNWDNERLAREVHRPESLVLESDRTPVDIAWRRTHALLNHIRKMAQAPDLAALSAALESLNERVAMLQRNNDEDEDELRALFSEITAIRRGIALANPLLDFDQILFIKRHRALYPHMCDQYYGIAARPGGGLYVLEDAFGSSPRVRNLLADAVVESGRLQGHALRGGESPPNLHYDGHGRLLNARMKNGGAFLSPDLSFDGTRILFSFVEGVGNTKHRYHWGEGVNYWTEQWDPGRAFHVFKINSDGTGLKQLTDGPWNDIHACWLPDGDIAFISERRGGFLRCGRICPTYTMFRMDSSGHNIRPLSYHEIHEWLPSVDNDGRIVYTRWDYVDRDADIAHHIWLKYPDGRDPRAPHGNYPRVLEMRPWMEMSIRSIPGSHRYLAVAAPHHGQNFGSLVTIDVRIEDDYEMSQLRRVTPEVMLPESEFAPGVPFERGRGGKGQVFGTPWPLDEDFYLAVYDPGEQHYGMYLVDAFGNRDLLLRDPDIGVSDPIPFRARPTPPVIPDQTRYAADPADQPAPATVSVMNVYDSQLPWPEGTRLRELRLIQLFPKSYPIMDRPNIGSADVNDEALARGVIGVVPIEEDGSAYFEMPAGVPFYIQALDENGMAVQTMRSASYVHPGETMSCVGCHEPKHRAPRAPGSTPISLGRPPSIPQPEAEGSYPLTFPRLVQPVLNRNCLECHEQNRDGGAPGLRGDVFAKHGHSEAFRSLAPFGWAKFGGTWIGPNKPQTSYSIPGAVGARASQLWRLLADGHHGVELSPEDMRRITLWLDANTLFYGDYFDAEYQARGGTPAPRLH